MPQCSAINCKNRGMHLFPKNPKRKKQWENALRIKNFKASATSRLCAIHFKESDYFGKSKYTDNEPLKKFLNKTAVPSIFSFTKIKTETPSALERQNRFERRSIRTLFQDPNLQPSTSISEISPSKHLKDEHFPAPKTTHQPKTDVYLPAVGRKKEIHMVKEEVVSDLIPFSMTGFSSKSTYIDHVDIYGSVNRKMTVEIYGLLGSAPCRTVLLAAKAFDVDVELKPVDLFKGEHLTPEYLKMNPQHTIPTMVDKELVLTESRAIIRYFANQYAKNSPLYPEEPDARARVDQKLDFDLGTLYPAYANYFYPINLQNQPPNPDLYKKLETALGFLNIALEKQRYVAGFKLTIADLAIVVTISNVELIENSLTDFPYIQRWYGLVRTSAPGYEEINGKGVEAFKQILEMIKSKNSS